MLMVAAATVAVIILVVRKDDRPTHRTGSVDAGIVATTVAVLDAGAMSDSRAGSVNSQASGLDSGVDASVGAQSEAAAHLLRGRELLARNTPEAASATRDGLKAAAHEIETAIRLGYDEKGTAYGLLGDVAWQIAVWGTADAPDTTVWKDRSRQAYAKVLELRPDDVDARMRYVSLLSSPQDQLAQLRLVLAKEPENGTALYAVGSIVFNTLIPQHSASPVLIEEAARDLVQAARVLPPAELTVRGPEVVAMLERNGRAADAKEAQKMVRERQAAENR